MSAGMSSRSEKDLTEDERHALDAAHGELRGAIEAYEAFLGKDLKAGEQVPKVRTEVMQEAQERVEAAENELWELRERLLGWTRPPWAPPATLVSDWILEDDPGYEDAPEATLR